MKVVADLNVGDRALYVLALEGLSIVGALYHLARCLALRLTAQCAERSEYAAVLVEVLRPMALRARLLPPDAAWEANATLRVSCVEAGLPEEKMDVLRFAVCFHGQNNSGETASAISIDDFGAAVTAAHRSALGTAEPLSSPALEEEWAILMGLDGFQGDAESFFARLSVELRKGALLAKSCLFQRTVERAYQAIYGACMPNEATQNQLQLLAGRFMEICGEGECAEEFAECARVASQLQ